MRREAAPTRLVLQLVENILRVAAIAIELAEAGEVFDERGDQNAILMDAIAGADLEGKTVAAGLGLASMTPPRRPSRAGATR